NKTFISHQFIGLIKSGTPRRKMGHRMGHQKLKKVFEMNVNTEGNKNKKASSRIHGKKLLISRP
ncbi:MAG: hypothetical protein ACQEWD_13005, partial [Bacteroidota bacterium]